MQRLHLTTKLICLHLRFSQGVRHVVWDSQKNLPLKKSASLNANYFPHETEKVELLECLIANNILKSGRKYNSGTNILFL